MLFKVAGVSRFNCEEIKVRFANDLSFVKKLVARGDTDIELLEAPKAMTKHEITDWLKTTKLYENLEYQEAIDNRSQYYAKIAEDATKVKRHRSPRGTRVVRGVGEKGAKTTSLLETIKERALEVVGS